jgi:DNA-binding cell septation regulator SpoVG
MREFRESLIKFEEEKVRRRSKMSEEFQIIRIRKCEGTDKEIKALVDIQVGQVEILGVKIIESRGQTFCALPSENFYSQSAGKTLNRSIIHLEENLKMRIYAEILERWYHMEQLKFRTEGKSNE